jgi:hypothetical protein
VNDRWEQAADHAADRVMQMREPEVSSAHGPAAVQRKCASCEQEDETKRVSMRAEAPSTSAPGTAAEAPPAVRDALRGPSQPLDAAARAFFEPRFGRDFSHVRIHTDDTAVAANRSISARAFAVGSHIAFSPRAYAPSTRSGRHLLAHELAHVVQQAGAPQVVRGDFIDDAKEKAEKIAEDFAKARLGQLANADLGPPSGFTGDAKCGPRFCQPFTSKAVAFAHLAWAGPLLLAGIAKKVNSRVVPLWADYLSGGSAPRNLSSEFGKDFTASPTTAKTTKFLVDELRRDVTAHQASLLGSASTRTLDFTPRLSSALAAIDDPKKPSTQMNFNVIADIAGNIAGGIGKDETSFPIGARPSPFNDSREASVQATLTRQSDGSLEVSPSIQFTVKDTLDLCPGDCGAPPEQVATIPLSRFEATGVSGDVPMTIEFAAPAAELVPFKLPAAAPPAPVHAPAPGTVTASQLRIRRAPSTSAPVVGSYLNGAGITVLCQTKGTIVDGVDTWYKTDKGFIAGRYVALTGTTSPPPC